MYLFDINKKCFTKDKYEGESFTPTIELQTGATYFLVHVSWTSGDSGGHDGDSFYHHLVDAYRTYDEAKVAAEAIVAAHDNSDMRSIPDFRFANGIRHPLSLRWEYYFERLELVEIIPAEYSDEPVNTMVFYKC